MELRFQRTDSTNKDFIALVRELDAELAVRDGDDHAFYAQFNKTNLIRHVLLVYENEMVVSCGAIKDYDSETMEVKRMYTVPNSRSKGIASLVLQQLEKWAAELGMARLILETGINQPEAIHLYKKNNYIIIPNYGQYAGIANSICFEKQLIY